MIYTFSKDKILTNAVEYSVAYHCNLRCNQCSHLSPFMKEGFPSLDSFKDDLYRLSEMMHAKVIRLLGGEPLLNPEIDRFIAIARKSNIADRVMVTTNGLLLHRMSANFWKNVDDVLVSLYPGIALKEGFRTLKQRARAHNTRLWFQFISHFRTSVVIEPHEKSWVTALVYRSCRDAHLFHCHMVHEGMLYKCPLPPFLRHYLVKFNQTYDPHSDGFAIHDHPGLTHGLEDYLTDMHAKEACRYCFGELGRIIPHTQLTPFFSKEKENGAITGQNKIENTCLLRAGCDFFYRRFMEWLTGKKRW